MGGKALKQTVTRRYSANEYHAILPRIVDKLTNTLYVESVKAYGEKESFGDADIVVVFESDVDPVQLITQQFRPNQLVENRSVISFDYEQLQVDIIIFSEMSSARFASQYFAFNDLGNFIGRTAHRLGFKFGQTGLHYILRDSDTVQIAELLVTDDFSSALQFLDYDPLIHLRGFDTLDQIFDYVATSRYFEPAQYLLQNRTSEARKRDRVRPSYIAILQYMQTRFDLNEMSEKVPVDRLWHLRRAFETFPQFKRAYDFAIHKHYTHKQYRTNFNGDLIREWYGLSGIELGHFMRQWTHYFESHDLIESISKMSVTQFKYLLESHIKENINANQIVT